MTKRKVAKKMVGYQRKGYSWGKSISKYKKTGKFKYVKSGEGHRAGENWGDAKEIDPESQTRRYSKNSPSFDEGVYLSKKKRMAGKMGATNPQGGEKGKSFVNLGGM